MGKNEFYGYSLKEGTIGDRLSQISVKGQKMKRLERLAVLAGLLLITSCAATITNEAGELRRKFKI